MSSTLHNLRRFFKVSPHERAQLVRAFVVVGGVCSGLTLLPFPRFQTLFERYGYPVVVHIGVARGESAGRDRDRDFQALAWLESDGKVVIGESTVPYTPLTTLAVG